MRDRLAVIQARVEKAPPDRPYGATPEETFWLVEEIVRLRREAAKTCPEHHPWSRE